MTSYMVGIRLDGDSGEEIIKRIAAWKLAEDEGVLSISAQPEMVVVPDELRAEPAMTPTSRPPAQHIAPVQ